MRFQITKIYYLLVFYKNRIFEYLFSRFPSNVYDIPIIINNRNRFTFLLRLIESLEKRGYYNIIILDNASTYPPLLEYYKSVCKYEIIFLNGNLGHLALWKSKYFSRFRNSYYVYTDPDLEIAKECPDNFLFKFLNTLKSDYKIDKIGLGLIVNDLPDEFEMKNEVIEWESRFKSVEYNSDYFIAHVDTTFALYRPFASGGSNDFKLTLRSKYPFEVHHLPWYNNTKNMTPEDIFYLKNAKSSTFWSIKTITN